MSGGLDINVEIDSRRVREAFARAPATMMEHLSRGLQRGALEISREAKREAPKAFSTLTNSITVARETPLRMRIWPTVNYGAAVEEGSGPGSRPSKRTILGWLRVKRVVPNDPDMDEDDLAFVIARAIAHRGIPPQPYMQPALQEKESRVIRLIRRGVNDGLAAAGL